MALTIHPCKFGTFEPLISPYYYAYDLSLTMQLTLVIWGSLEGSTSFFSCRHFILCYFNVNQGSFHIPIITWYFPLLQASLFNVVINIILGSNKKEEWLEVKFIIAYIWIRFWKEIWNYFLSHLDLDYTFLQVLRIFVE